MASSFSSIPVLISPVVAIENNFAHTIILEFNNKVVKIINTARN